MPIPHSPFTVYHLPMLRILLIGGEGQVGWELGRTLAPLGTVHAPLRSDLDLESADSIIRVVRETRAQLIVNAAAYTAVDRAETDVDTATRVNGDAVGILAEEAIGRASCRERVYHPV